MNSHNISTIVRGLSPVESILIINPINAGGGDRSTGLKVKACFETMGCLTKLLPIKLPIEFKKNINELCNWAITQTEQLILDDHSRSVIRAEPLVVITPLNKTYCTAIKPIFDTIDKHIPLKKDRLLIINEMAYQPDEKETALYQELLKSLKFSHVKECTLGFEQSQIGYMKLTDSELAEIKQNYRAGIKKFCDSLNIDINTENNLLFFSYLSSDKPSTCALNFIKNSRIEVQAVDKRHQNKEFHYVFVVRDHSDKQMAVWMANNLALWEKSSYYVPGTSVRIFCLTNNKLKLELEKSNEHCPKGRCINIYLVNQAIPMPVFRYFIALSTFGAMTGDNSFWEYLSIKKSLPYYEMQPWKSGFVEGWWKLAEASGIPHLKAFYQARCFGEWQTVGKWSFPRHFLSMTKINKDLPGGKEEMTELETVALVKEITKRKHEFEAKMFARDARRTLQALCRPNSAGLQDC